MDDKKPALSDDLKKVYDQVMNTPSITASNGTPQAKPNEQSSTLLSPAPNASTSPQRVSTPASAPMASASSSSSPITDTKPSTSSATPTSSPSSLGDAGRAASSSAQTQNDDPSPVFASIPPRPIKTVSSSPIAFSSSQGQSKTETKSTSTPVMNIKEHKASDGGGKFMIVLLPLGLLFLAAYTLFWMVVFGLIDPKAYGF